MIKRKHMVIVFLVSCLTGTLLGIGTTGSQNGIGEYDPWKDLDDDGWITIADVSAEAVAFGSYGDPTKNVKVTYAHYSWWTEFKLNSTSPSKSFINDTSGYKQLTLVVRMNIESFGCELYFGIWYECGNLHYLYDTVTLNQSNNSIFQTYDIVVPRVCIYFHWVTGNMSVLLSCYVTA